jgi:hypothetical protein
MSTTKIHADKIVMDAECRGSLLRLIEPLSFWGGFNPADGTITDVHHPQCGLSIAAKVLLLERTRGSTSSTGDLVEAMRLGSGPAGIILGKPDLTVVTAVLVAAELYEMSIPVLLIDPCNWRLLQTGTEVSISAGVVSLSQADRV